MTSTLAIGLDGGNWGLIEEWLDRGDLPNIQHLREEGVYAVSKSEHPPVTCPNWKCYSTSKNPGELGVFWWERIDMQNRTISFPDASSFASAELWDYFADQGAPWLCLNMPTTFPPRNVPNGDIIAGGPLCADSGYTSDPSLEGELRDRFSYKVRPALSLTNTENSEDEVEAILDLIDLRFDVLEWYIEEHDPKFAHVTLFLLNLLQHYFWNDEPVHRAWKRIDERIGKFIEPNRNIVLMSDHGCNQVDAVFHINQWLEEQGYLTTRTGISTMLDKIGLTKERATRVVEAIGARSLAKKAPSSLKNLLPQEGEGAKREAKSNMVAWDDSLTLASGQGPVYLNLKHAHSGAQFREQLIDELSQLRTPDDRPVANRVLTKEEAYSGRSLDIAPDIVIEQAPGIHISDGVGHGQVFSEPSRWNAENERDGLFLAHGPNIKSDVLAPVSILDIAPTILHLHSMAVPTDMEGEVLSIFTDDVRGPDAVETREPLTVDNWGTGDAGIVEQRLEDLGYIGQ